MKRPDIAFAVSVVSQFMSSPTIKHWEAFAQILWYLKSAPILGRWCSNHDHTHVKFFFADVDYEGSKINRRSTTSYCVFVGENLVFMED